MPSPGEPSKADRRGFLTASAVSLAAAFAALHGRAQSPSMFPLPFVVMVFLCMVLVYVFPGIVLWLPDYLYTPR